VLGSLLGVAALFALPVVLLGCIPPFALRLSVKSTDTSGNAAGRVYALSTIGSLVGTFGTVFLLIPNLGTRSTIVFIAALLLSLAFLGLLQHIGRRALVYLLLLAAILALQLLPSGAIKPGQSMIYETDSAYNYIQVLRNGEEIVLRLNEGEGIQSAYRPRQVLTGYVYDYFLLVPLFRNAPLSPPVSSLCLIGLAAGTTARQYTAVFGEIPIDGVEIDPAIVDAGMRFFDLKLPNLQVVVADGRYYLAHSGQVYDVIIVDAYRPPYIPFHLATLEFFGEVRDHLAPDGVVAINVARTESDYALVDAIASTLKAIYPNVYIMDALGNLNSVVVATEQPSRFETITTRLSELGDPVLQNVALRAAGRIREFTMPNSRVLTDDHAPVEQIVHSIAARFLLGQQQVQEVHQ
jgi:spermidine synthase